MKITDEMIEAGVEAYKNPKGMLLNTSDGNAYSRMKAALEAALTPPDLSTEELRADEMTPGEVLNAILRRPEMFGLVSKKKYKQMKAKRSSPSERVTENSVRHVKLLTTKLQNKHKSLNDQRREYGKLLAKARAERDALAGVIRSLRFNDASCLGDGIDCTESVSQHAEEIARAVAEWMKGESK